MPAIVTLAEAKTSLRILGTDYDSEITARADQASGIVRDYITRDEAEMGDDDKAVLKAATIEVIRNLMGEGKDGGLTQGVKNILRRFRDPSLA